MLLFNYMAAAELFPARTRLAERHSVASRRFAKAAEAIRFAMEELEPDLLEGSYLEVGEDVFDGVGIRNLYARDAYPLRKPVPYSAAVQVDQTSATERQMER